MNAVEHFTALHHGPAPLILPNAWDVASALLFQARGFAAVGTTSLGVTAAAGLPDGAAAGRLPTLALARALVARLDVPVTVDLEGGHSDDPAEVALLTGELAATGVAGVNLEDGRRSAAHHAEIVAAAAGTGVFVNARTDAYWLGLPGAFELALERVVAYRGAGASGVFVPGATDLAELRALADAAGVPLNVLAGSTSPAELHAHGVARVSTGSALYRAALTAAAASAEAARSGALPPGLSYEEVQHLITHP